jgi:polyphosphate kinase
VIDEGAKLRLVTSPQRHLLDRDQSILAFNERVLAMARREDVPLMERLRYLCIVSSNLDEFFEIRFADSVEAAAAADTAAARAVAQEGASGTTEHAHRLIEAQYALFNEVLTPALAAQGIEILTYAERNADQRAWVEAFFRREVRPLLVPISLDPSHPFPQVANKSLHFIVELGGHDAFGRENRIAIVKVPRVLPRVIRLPAALAEGRQAFVLLSSVVRAHLADLFPGRTVEGFSQFRLTRDSDLGVDELDVTNLRQALRIGLSQRQFGHAVRLEVARTCPEALSNFLLTQFELPPMALYRVNGPVNLVRLTQLIDLVEGPALFHTPFTPAWPAALDPARRILEQLRERDVLLHHPFESFEPVVALLREAVLDPDVLAIKQTIYRTGADSELMELLLEATRRGKEVTAVVELKARFDEEANINWADRLEALGAQVVYGVVGLKTHAKMLLVTRREGTRLRRYGHLSTGNYNTRTARLYTDLGLMTAQPALCADMEHVFQHLASQSRVQELKALVAAPFALHRHMMERVHEVEAAARAGHNARIVLKLNALTDEPLALALASAARAGARVDLIVRGACILPADVPGFSDGLRVRSVVGRFLEHTRVFYFSAGDQQRLYLSSADWMGRNMFRRIEIAWPITDAAQRQRIIDECLVAYLHDSQDAWQAGAGGGYRRVAETLADEAQRHSAQVALMNRYRRARPRRNGAAA